MSASEAAVNGKASKKSADKAKAPEKKVVIGIDVEKVDWDVLRDEFRKAIGIEAPSALDETVKALANHFVKADAERKPGEDWELVKCSTCGGSSPSTLEACPFCGDEDEAEIVEPKNKKGQAIVKVGEAAIVPSDKLKTSPQPAIVVQFTEGDLDVAVEEIKRCITSAAVSTYALGLKLLHVFNGELWRQRNTKEGKPAYKGFKAFVEAEIQLSTDQVYRIMEVAQKFTEEQVRKFGVTVLSEMLVLPKGTRETMVKQLEAGQIPNTKRGVAAEVSRIRAEQQLPPATDRLGASKEAKGSTARDTSKATKASAAASAEKPKVITVALQPGKTRIPLMAKKAKKSEEDRPAKRLGDMPCAVVELRNGVRIHFSVVANAAGHLELIQDVRRDA